MKSTVLIVTNKLDAHSDNMVRKLNELGHHPVRLNTNSIPSETLLSFELGGEYQKSTINILENQLEIKLQDVKSIWWRRPDTLGFSIELSERERRFAIQETHAAFWGSLAALDCYWMSFPNDIQRANNKVEQMSRAMKLGFRIPRTLITNEPENVRTFHKMCKKGVIYKVLTDPMLSPTKPINPDDLEIPEPQDHIAVQTTLITSEELVMVDSVRNLPCLFQEYVPKAYELRVTVIGEKVFAVKIDSQLNESSKVDWRMQSGEIPHYPYKLPSDIEANCISLVRSFNLNYSAIDLIVTPEGEYIFLESNPNGQFMWIEHFIPEYEMTIHLANCLIQGRSC